MVTIPPQAIGIVDVRGPVTIVVRPVVTHLGGRQHLALTWATGIIAAELSPRRADAHVQSLLLAGVALDSLHLVAIGFADAVGGTEEPSNGGPLS